MAGKDTEALMYCYKRWFFKSTIIQSRQPTSCSDAKEVAKKEFRDIGVWLSPDSVNIYCIKNKRKVYITADNWNLDSFKGFPALYLEPRSKWAQFKQVLKNYGPLDPRESPDSKECGEI